MVQLRIKHIHTHTHIPCSIVDTYGCTHLYVHWRFQWNGAMTINFKNGFKRKQIKIDIIWNIPFHKRVRREKRENKYTHTHYNPIFIWSFWYNSTMCIIINIFKWMGCRQTFHIKLNVLLKCSFLLILPFHFNIQIGNFDSSFFF